MKEPRTAGVERVLSSELIYRGKVFKVRKVAIEKPSGRRGTRLFIEHSGSVAVVPLLDDGSLVLIRQFRLAAGGVIWEIPAGGLEPGERPDDCARRELEEETGYRAARVEPLFAAYASPGTSSELMRFFLATGLEKKEQRTEEDEIITVEQLEVDEVLRLIRSGEIRDEKTIAAVAYLVALGKIGERPQGGR
jgi:ADP-ribose pyrophosphatase